MMIPSRTPFSATSVPLCQVHLEFKRKLPGDSSSDPPRSRRGTRGGRPRVQSCHLARPLEVSMIHTIGWKELRQLAAFRAEHGCALSLYVGLEPAGSGDLRPRLQPLVDEA